MADPTETVGTLLHTIVNDPVYLLLTAGAVALFVLFIVGHHIHKIRSEEIFVHQAWGANWKGR